MYLGGYPIVIARFLATKDPKIVNDTLQPLEILKLTFWLKGKRKNFYGIE